MPFYKAQVVCTDCKIVLVSKVASVEPSLSTSQVPSLNYFIQSLRHESQDFFAVHAGATIEHEELKTL